MMFRYVTITVVLTFCAVQYNCSQNDKKSLERIIFIDSIKRSDAVRYMGGGSHQMNLDVQNDYGYGVKVHIYDSRTKKQQSTDLELLPDEEYRFSFIDRNEINIYTTYENETSDHTIFLKRLDKNSLELLSSEIVLTSIPKNELNLEDFNNYEVLHPTIKSDNVFLRNSLKIKEVVSMTFHYSPDTSQYMFNTIFEDEKGNIQVSSRIYDIKTRKELNFNFGLGLNKNEFNMELIWMQLLNNGQVLFSLRKKENEKVVGWTYYLLHDKGVASFKVKKQEITLLDTGSEEMGECWEANSTKTGILTHYILFENSEKRILGKATVDILNKKLSGVRTLQLHSDVKSNSFKVIRFENDEIFCFGHLEKKQKDMEPSKNWKPGKPSSYKYDVFTKTESYVVRLDSSLKEKWSMKRSLDYTERTFPCLYRWEKMGGNLIVNLFEPSRETCDIVDINTGKVIVSRILQQFKDENESRITKAYKIYSAFYGKYIHSYNRDKEVVMVYELK